MFVVIMGSAFSIAIAVDNAIKNILPIYTKAALTMGANKSQLYRYVIFPASLPELVSGLKQGWSFLIALSTAIAILNADPIMTTNKIACVDNPNHKMENGGYDGAPETRICFRVCRTQTSDFGNCQRGGSINGNDTISFDFACFVAGVLLVFC